MSKMRVYEYAKQRNLTSKEVLNHLKELKVDVSNHMSTITSEVASQLDEKLKPKKETTNKKNRKIKKENESNKIKNRKKEIINIIKKKINNQNKSRQRKKKHLKKLSIMAP